MYRKKKKGGDLYLSTQEGWKQSSSGKEGLVPRKRFKKGIVRRKPQKEEPEGKRHDGTGRHVRNLDQRRREPW